MASSHEYEVKPANHELKTVPELHWKGEYGSIPQSMELARHHEELNTCGVLKVCFSKEVTEQIVQNRDSAYKFMDGLELRPNYQRLQPLGNGVIQMIRDDPPPLPVSSPVQNRDTDGNIIDVKPLPTGLLSMSDAFRRAESPVVTTWNETMLSFEHFMKRCYSNAGMAFPYFSDIPIRTEDQLKGIFPINSICRKWAPLHPEVSSCSFMLFIFFFDILLITHYSQWCTK